MMWSKKAKANIIQTRSHDPNISHGIKKVGPILSSPPLCFARKMTPPSSPMTQYPVTLSDLCFLFLNFLVFSALSHFTLDELLSSLPNHHLTCTWDRSHSILKALLYYLGNTKSQLKTLIPFFCDDPRTRRGQDQGRGSCMEQG